MLNDFSPLPMLLHLYWISNDAGDRLRIEWYNESWVCLFYGGSTCMESGNSPIFNAEFNKICGNSKSMSKKGLYARFLRK
jgi:hypothetical protein